MVSLALFCVHAFQINSRVGSDGPCTQPVKLRVCLLSTVGKAILRITREPTKVPTMNTMQNTPNNVNMEV